MHVIMHKAKASIALRTAAVTITICDRITKQACRNLLQSDDLKINIYKYQIILYVIY